MSPDLEVDADALRACSSALADTGARVSAGATRPPIPPLVPRWATTDAAALAADGAWHHLDGIGAGLAAIARQTATTAAEYEAADARAARRLRHTR
jgi:hypothetical protein